MLNVATNNSNSLEASKPPGPTPLGTEMTCLTCYQANDQLESWLGYQSTDTETAQRAGIVTLTLDRVELTFLH